MSPLLRKLLGMNWVLFASMFTLAIFGIVAVYSASYFKTDDYWHMQAAWVGIGLVVFLAPASSIIGG
jgi:cell division protein FtsW (lipid II flippase)